MNLWQLVAKQMRQRALSTWLTLLSVTLGVALAVAVLVLFRASDRLLGQSEFGYDVLIGPKGSRLQLVLNTTYDLGSPPGNIPYKVYEDLSRRHARLVRWAVPWATGDFYQGHRVIATTPLMFGVGSDGSPARPGRGFEYRPDRALSFAMGRPFHGEKFEAVIGSDAAAATGLSIGDAFRVQHGSAGPGAAGGVGVAGVGADDHGHDEQWTVVGILNPTRTSLDRLIYVPLPTFFAIPDHDEYLQAVAGLDGTPTGATAPDSPADPHAGHDGHHHDHAYTLNADGTIVLHSTPDQWRLSSILVRTRGGGFASGTLAFAINNSPEAMAVNPAAEMRAFTDQFLRPQAWLLLGVAVLVSVVAAVSILVSIYNAVSARHREIAILRALGASRGRVLAMICCEAVLIGVAGAAVGWLAGHGVAAVASGMLQNRVGQGIEWWSVGPTELAYVGGVVLLAGLAGLVPALKAYATPVAANLTRG